MYPPATARSSRRLSRSTAASAGFTSRVVRVLTSTQQNMSDQVDFAATLGRAEIAPPGHHLSEPSQIDASDPECCPGQSLSGDPVEKAKGSVGKTSREHRLAPRVCRLCHNASAWFVVQGEKIRGPTPVRKMGPAGRRNRLRSGLNVSDANHAG